MNSPASRFTTYRPRAIRRRHRLAPAHWLDMLAANAPDDDILRDPAQLARVRDRMRIAIRIRTRPMGQIRQLWPGLQVAAALLPLLLAGAWLWLRTPAPAARHYATGVGQHREVVLPDSSHVWLHPRSELTWTTGPHQERRVTLRGEAFFAVTRDPAHPFVVRAAGVAVRVLGTSFLVKADPRLPTTTVLVRTGRVAVADRQQRLAILHPHDQLIYTRHNRHFALTHHAYTDGLATNQLLTFEQANLADILVTLENYYPIHFRVRPDLPPVVLSGTLDPALSAAQIADVLNTLLQRHHIRITPLTPTTYRVR